MCVIPPSTLWLYRQGLTSPGLVFIHMDITLVHHSSPIEEDQICQDSEITLYSSMRLYILQDI